MMAKQRFSRRWYSRFFVLAAAFLLAGNCLFAAEGHPRDSEGAGYKIIPLKYISAEQGKRYLADVGIGTVSHFPGSAVLLVTAQPRELTKAEAILNLVDGPEQFVIRAVYPASAAKNMPSNEQITARVAPGLATGISIGNFSNPPNGDTPARALIDIHNDAVVAVVPIDLLERIISAIEQLPNPGKLKAQDKPATPDNRPVPKLARPNGLRPQFAARGTMETKLNTAATAPVQKVANQAAPKPSAAIGPAESMSIANGEEILKLDLPEKLTIVDLLGLVGPYLEMDFMYDPRQLMGEVTLNPNGKFRGPIKVKDLYPLLESVLKFKGFVMTRGRGNLVTVVPVANALDIDPVLLGTDDGEIERGDVIVTRTFKLEHVDTANAEKLLTDMRLTTSIIALSETKTLIVTGYAYRMARIETLLKMIDQPGEPKKFRFRQLQYTMAQTLYPKIQSLAEHLGTITVTVATTSPAPTTPSAQRAGESTTAYRNRIAAEARTAAARAAAARRTTAAQQAARAATQPQPTKPTVYIDADERTNRILMIGLDEQLDDVEELIDTLDVAQQDLRTLQLYKIEHVDAEEVKKKLEELGVIGVSQPTASPRIAGTGKPPVTQSSRTPTIRTSTTGATTETPLEEPQVVVVEPTNSLLVNATAEQHTRIASIISYVDSETLEEEIPYKIYPLENSSPEHLKEVLGRLIEETVLDKEGKIEEVVKKQEEQITIVDDPNTYSLIVYASKKNQEWIGNLVEQLDKRRPQVLIDVTLVEVSRTDSFAVDLELVSKMPRFDIGGQMAALEALLSPFPEERVIEGTSFSGAGTGFYSDRHIQALLTAIQTKNYGRVLAKPKILVNDNQTGIISTTDTTYVTKTSSIPVASGAAGQQTALIETAVEFEGYDAGIQLEITPHVSEGDLLRLDIRLTRSDFGAITGEKPPDTTSSDIDTDVTVPDGSTIILGGMVKLNQSKGGTKIPILGDIPLIGGLFRSISNSDLQRNLYVFVKAEVLRPQETLAGLPHLEKISERNRVAFELFEERFQKYQDWPGVEPKPMEPFKVLDAQ